MKLWLISQTVNKGCDVYDSAIVAALNATQARHIHPDGEGQWDDHDSTWAYDPSQVMVKLVGEALKGTPSGVILASFNAG